MKRLLLVSALALLTALASTLFVRPDWAVDAGVFHAFLAALAIIAALAVNSVIARRPGLTAAGPFGSGLLTVAQAFWITMAINVGCGWLVLQFESVGQGPDSYAIGFGAILPQAIAVLAPMACLAFAIFKWWPLRLFLATASGCTTAFACMAITWWL